MDIFNVFYINSIMTYRFISTRDGQDDAGEQKGICGIKSPLEVHILFASAFYYWLSFCKRFYYT